MHIARIDAFACGLPLKKPVKMAGEEVTRADNVYVRVQSADGVVGWGEAGSAPTMTGETVGSMVAAIHLMTPRLMTRDPRDIEGAIHVMDAALYGNKSAKAAIEIALHDLWGRETGQPVHALLGGKKRDTIATMATIGSGDDVADLEEARRLRANGHIQFKIKVGIGPWEHDAWRTRALCEAIGAGCTISADANQGWSVEDAVAYVCAVADTRLDFFEQPVRAENIKGMAQVAAASRVAVGADEAIHSLEDIERHAAAHAVKGVALKCIKLGGLRGVVAAGALCERLGLEINVSCKTGESSVASAAAAHAASVLPSVAWGLSVTQGGLQNDVTAEPLKVENGRLRVSDAPGLGIEVDEDRLRRFAI